MENKFKKAIKTNISKRKIVENCVAKFDIQVTA